MVQEMMTVLRERKLSGLASLDGLRQSGWYSELLAAADDLPVLSFSPDFETHRHDGFGLRRFSLFGLPV